MVKKVNFEVLNSDDQVVDIVTDVDFDEAANSITYIVDIGTPDWFKNFEIETDYIKVDDLFYKLLNISLVSEASFKTRMLMGLELYVAKNRAKKIENIV